MKKIFILLTCLILCSCESVKREDYYTLSFGSYSLTVGYDNVEYLDVIFDFDIKETLDINETVKDIEINTIDKSFGLVNIINKEDETIDSNKGIITSLSIYAEDINDEVKIDNIKLTDSVSENCSLFNGNMVNKNGSACIIQKEVNNENDVVILYGDILSDNQDTLKRIEIYIEE